MSAPPRLVAISTAVPQHVVRQADAREFAAKLFASAKDIDERLMQVFDHAGIDQRHVCMPLEWFGSDHSFAEKNDLYVEHAVRLAGEAAGETLRRAGLSPRDVDHIVFVSTTGVATPSIDARLVHALGFRENVRRTPIFGLGCAGGTGGLATARDLALANPSGRVLFIALELCTLTFQHGELSRRNLVAASLFGDGAAAALIVGGDVAASVRDTRRPVELVASQSTLWKDTLDVMGWNVDGNGLHVIFSQDIPTIVHEKVLPSLTAFLDAQGLSLGQIQHMVFHPGGTKVQPHCPARDESSRGTALS